MTLTGAEVALCVVIPLLVISLVLLVLCFLANRKLFCFRKSEDQALLSISSRMSSANQQSGNAVITSSIEEKSKTTTKTKSLNHENSYVSLSLVNPSYVTSSHVTSSTHPVRVTTTSEPEPLKNEPEIAAETAPKQPETTRKSTAEPTTALLAPPTDTSGGKRGSQPEVDVGGGGALGAPPQSGGGGGYLSLGDNSSNATSRRSSMEIINPENGKNLLFPGRRRSSMQVPIDIRAIDPKLYGMTKMTSFDSEGIDDTTKPIINLSVRYCAENEELIIKLIQARNLEAGDGNPIGNPYCSIQLMPDYVIHRSKTHHDTRDPEFEESFRFPLLQEEIDDKTLRLKVFDADQFARDECSGLMDLKLKEIDFELNSTSGIDMWRTVQPLPAHMKDMSSKPARNTGDLMLGLSYLPSAEKLTITIQKARNLNFSAGAKKSDAFVKVSLYQGATRLKKKKTNTATMTSQSNLVFDEALTFNICHQQLKLRDVRLICEVMRDVKLKSNKTVIGWLELSLTCESTVERQHWSEMVSEPNHTPVARWHTLREPNDHSSSSDS